MSQRAKVASAPFEKATAIISRNWRTSESCFLFSTNRSNPNRAPLSNNRDNLVARAMPRSISRRDHWPRSSTCRAGANTYIYIYIYIRYIYIYIYTVDEIRTRSPLNRYETAIFVNFGRFWNLRYFNNHNYRREKSIYELQDRLHVWKTWRQNDLSLEKSMQKRAYRYQRVIRGVNKRPLRSSGGWLQVHRKSTATHRYTSPLSPAWPSHHLPPSFPTTRSECPSPFPGSGDRRVSASSVAERAVPTVRRRRCRAVAWRYTSCGDLANFTSLITAFPFPDVRSSPSRINSSPSTPADPPGR